MSTYAILRDLSGASMAGPWVLARDPSVRALAPVMPTRLVRPVEVGDAEAATTAWGIGAVGADSSSRTGVGVVVAILDTGIDAGHSAFAGATLVEEDFTGSSSGQSGIGIQLTLTGC